MFISGIKSLEVEWRELRALNGLDLKVYVLVRNFPGRLTCREIARLLGVQKGQVWLSLLRLTDRFYVRHDAQGRYEQMQFFVPWMVRKEYGDRSEAVRSAGVSSPEGNFGIILRDPPSQTEPPRPAV